MSSRISRRGFVAATAAAQAARGQNRPPNIVVIFSDDHSYPYVGVNGSAYIQTPNLDRFAASGMRFTSMFTAAPQCVPSRAAYMTGRSPVAIRMGRFSSPLPRDVRSLPDMLRPIYFTGICRRNFHLDGPGRTGPFTTKIFRDHQMKTFQSRVDFLNVSGDRSRTAEIVTGFLDKVPEGKPFFLWVNFNDPHHVWDKDAIPKPHDPSKLNLPPHLPDLPGMRADLARYCDEVTRADDEFGQVLGVLDKRGLTDNTVVVFAGDNGMAFPHGKGSLYDPGLHVPLFVRWPGVVRPGSVNSDLISGEDLTPTLLDIANQRYRPDMTGRSFLPALRNQAYPDRQYIFAARLAHGSAGFTETTTAASFDLSRCVRSSRYKLIYNCTPHMRYEPVDSARDAGWLETLQAHERGKLPRELEQAYFGKRPVFELYDLQNDPSELENLAGHPQFASIQQELTVALQEKMIIDYDFLPLPLAAE